MPWKKNLGLIKIMIDLKTNSVPVKLISAKGETLNLEDDICNEFSELFFKY